jgi:hypothetical protein
VPANDGVRCDDLDRPAPVSPEARQQDPEEPINRAKPRAAWRLALEDSELVTKGQDLCLEIEA